MILHGKDLIVSIDGNANMASKSCTLSVSAKSIVKTSPTSGDWEEVLSGKKSWNLTTNHLVKKDEDEGSTPVVTLSRSSFYFSNSTTEGWKARCEHHEPPRGSNYFDECGDTQGITVIEINTRGVITHTLNFDKDGMGTVGGSRKSLYQYLNGEVTDYVPGGQSIIAILTVGDFSINSDTCELLASMYHVALPCVEFGNVPTAGEKTYDTSPIIIIGGKYITHGFTSLNSISNEVVFNTFANQVYTPKQGIPNSINMTGKKVAVRMTDNNGDVWAGEAVVTQFKVTGTKGNLMAGSFSFKGNGELQTDSRLDYKPTPPPVYVNRIIIDIFQEIMANTHRYLAKYRGYGNMALLQLDDNNSNIFEEGGVSAPLDGSQGDVYTRIGGIFVPGSQNHYYLYYKITDLGNKRYEIAVSSKAMQGFSTFDTEANLIASFRAQPTTDYNNTEAGVAGGEYYLRSIANGQPVFADTFANLDTAMGRMNPDYFGKVGPEEHAIVALLYYMKYGNPNSQTMCGPGGSGQTTGASAIMGIRNTDNITGTSFVNLFGLEDWWRGGEGEYMERIKYADGKIYIKPWGSQQWDEGTAISTPLTNEETVIRNMLFSSNPLMMIPAGSQSPQSKDWGTYFCDGVRIPGHSEIVTRGKGDDAFSGGLVAMKLGRNTTAEDKDATRLCFRNGTLEYFVTPEDFLALTAVDPAN